MYIHYIYYMIVNVAVVGWKINIYMFSTLNICILSAEQAGNGRQKKEEAIERGNILNY